MKKLITIVITFVFMFEAMGYCASDILYNANRLRKPIDFNINSTAENQRYLCVLLAAICQKYFPRNGTLEDLEEGIGRMDINGSGNMLQKMRALGIEIAEDTKGDIWISHDATDTYLLVHRGTGNSNRQFDARTKQDFDAAFIPDAKVLKAWPSMTAQGAHAAVFVDQFPSYVADMSHPFNVREGYFESFLNRHRSEWNKLRGYGFPAIIRRARIRVQDNNKPEINILVLGAGTGEELARVFHELVLTFQSLDEHINEWVINISGIELRPELVYEGKKRLTGKSAFVSALYMLDGYRLAIAKEYSEAIIKSLNDHEDIVRSGLRLYQGDALDPVVLQPFAHGTDLVVANFLFRDLPDDRIKRMLQYLDGWDNAWLVIGDCTGKFDPRLIDSTVFQHDMKYMKSQDDAEEEMGASFPAGEYYFGQPRITYEMSGGFIVTIKDTLKSSRDRKKASSL